MSGEHCGSTPGAGPDVVVVAFGPSEPLERALAVLGDRHLVTVVDNSSSPSTRAVVERYGATYLDPGTNLGFAAAVNLALDRRREGVDVLLLNPDASIDQRSLGRLEAALRKAPGAACAAPAQRAPGSETLDRVCWPFPSPARAWLEAVGLGRLGTSCDFVIGSVLLLRSAAIEDVGLFDEGYFLYAEEADWQLRARRRGWTVEYCRAALAEHEGAGTGGDPNVRERYFHASQSRFVRKWYGPRGWRRYRAAQVAGAGVRVLARRGEDRARAARRGLLYARRPASMLEHRPGADRAPDRPGAASRSEMLSERPRVVHVVCTDAFAGVERYVVSVASGLVLQGWDVIVIGGHRDQMPRELTPAGVRWYPGSTVAGAAARLARLGHFDVAHAHMTDAELAVALARPRHGGRVVATRHFAQRRGSSAPARLVGRIIARTLYEQLSISEYVAAAIEGHSVVVLPGVGKVDDPADSSTRERRVLMVQRLEAEKRVEVGIEAFARSGLARSGWRLQIAGSGSAEQGLRDLSARLDLTEVCDFLGRRTDVDELYRAASIFLATRPDEPYGLSVVEAMAHGLAVVAARGGGHLETVGRHPFAALFTPGDVTGAASLLADLASDDTGRASYGAALREIQRERFTISRQIRETLPIYQSIRS